MNEKQSNPAVVCIMNPDDRIQLEGKSQDLSCCVTPYEVAKWINSGCKFPSVRENIIYMQNPLECDEYVYRTEETDEVVVKKRINAIETIVSLLGGKSYKVLSEIENVIKNDNDVSVDVDVKFFNSEINANTDVKKGIGTNDKEIIEVTAEWDGVYTKENYYKAEAVAKQYGLIDDPLIKSLLDQRHPRNPNFIKKKTYRVDVFRDLEKNLDVATKLQTNIKQTVNIDIDVNVKRTASNKLFKSFDFEVEFGPADIDRPNLFDHLLHSKESDSRLTKSKHWIWWTIGGIVVVGIVLGILLF